MTYTKAYIFFFNILNSAGQLLNAIYRIQNKSLCLYNIYMCVLCIYKDTHVQYIKTFILDVINHD